MSISNFLVPVLFVFFGFLIVLQHSKSKEGEFARYGVLSLILCALVFHMLTNSAMNEVDGKTVEGLLGRTGFLVFGPFAIRYFHRGISSVKKFVDISFLDKIALNRKYTLVLRLMKEKTDKIKDNIALTFGYAEEIEEIEIIVTMDAEDFEIEKPEQKMKVPLSKNSEPLVFYLTPKSIGKKNIRLKFYQDENYNGEIKIETTVYESANGLKGEPVTPQGKVGIYTEEGKNADLLIDVEIKDGYLEYTVQSAKLDMMNKKYRSEKPLHDPRQFMNDMLKDLSQISSETYTDEKKHEDIMRKIGVTGKDMYKRLIPKNLRDILWDNRDKIHSIFIVTEEQWIPWEIIKPYGASKDGTSEEDDFWCMKYVISRWLSSHFPEKEIPVKKSIIIAYDKGGKLKFVSKEKENVEKILRDKKLEIVSIEQECSNIHDLFIDKEINLFHFACESAYNEDNPDDSCIELSGVELDAQEIGVGNLRKGKPLIFVNACESGRTDYTFSGIGGFAKAFFDVGAQVFIGTMWKIPDEFSMKFSEEFYRNIFEEGLSVGEAMKATREKLRTQKNPSWLSYSLYSFLLAEIKSRR